MPSRFPLCWTSFLGGDSQNHTNFTLNSAPSIVTFVEVCKNSCLHDVQQSLLFPCTLWCVCLLVLSLILHLGWKYLGGRKYIYILHLQGAEHNGTLTLGVQLRGATHCSASSYKYYLNLCTAKYAISYSVDVRTATFQCALAPLLSLLKDAVLWWDTVCWKSQEMLSYGSHGNCNSASHGKAQRLSPYTITEDAEHMQSDQITVVADTRSLNFHAGKIWDIYWAFII